MIDIPKPIVAESSKYDNYLDEKSRLDDKYRSSLDAFFDEPIEMPVIQTIPKKKTEIENLARIINVHFRTIEDHLDFCNKIGQIVPFEKTEIFYPLENGIISDIDNRITNKASVGSIRSTDSNSHNSRI